MKKRRVVCPASVAEIAAFVNLSESETLEVLMRLSARSDAPISFDVFTGEVSLDVPEEVR